MLWNVKDDLDLLFAWSIEWQMQFNADKCKVMHIDKKNPFYEYKSRSSAIAKEPHDALYHKFLLRFTRYGS